VHQSRGAADEDRADAVALEAAGEPKQEAPRRLPPQRATAGRDRIFLTRPAGT